MASGLYRLAAAGTTEEMYHDRAGVGRFAAA